MFSACFLHNISLLYLNLTNINILTVFDVALFACLNELIVLIQNMNFQNVKYANEKRGCWIIF